MKKINVNDLQYKRNIYSSRMSDVWELVDGNYAKIVTDNTLAVCYSLGVDYERKILYSKAKYAEGIITPLSAIYNRYGCSGFVMKPGKGLNLDEDGNDGDIQKAQDLQRFCGIYRQMEKIVINANKLGIVMPDLCAFKNIIITPDDKVLFIDYDGMQFGKKDKAISFAEDDMLGSYKEYNAISKYSNGKFHFTPELDKTSLTVLLFKWIFNEVICVKALKRKDGINQEDLVSSVFEKLNIQDREFKRKVLANLSDNEPGAFLSEDLERIAKNYTMQATLAKDGQFIKCLNKK